MMMVYLIYLSQNNEEIQKSSDYATLIIYSEYDGRKLPLSCTRIILIHQILYSYI